MYLSLKLILEEVGLEPDVYDIPASMPKFRGVEFYSTREEHPHNDILYVATLTSALNAPKAENLYFLVVRDRMPDDSETEEAMRNIIIVQKNLDVVVLFNRISRLFTKFYKWNLEMERSLFNNEGIQKLLELSEDILQNFIIVHDGSYKSRGYTARIPIDDEIVEKLIAKGYHPEETMKLFTNIGRLSEFEKNRSITVNDDYATSKYIVVKKIFHSHNTISMFVVMFCNRRPPSDGMLEMFQMLLDNIKFYIDRDYDDGGQFAATKALLTDLLDGKAISGAELSSRAKYVSLPVSGNFKLCAFDFETTFTFPLRRLIYSISSAFANNIVFAYKNQIIVLMQSGTNRGESEWLELIKGRVDTNHDFLLPFNYICGVSNTFEKLEDSPIALKQAQKVISTARSFTGRENHVFSFEGTMIYTLLQSEIHAYRRLYTNSFIYTVLDRIREYDMEHSTNLFELLYHYLINECKVSSVSTMMHMHRNTVLYHLDKLENHLGVSFDDFETRLKIVLAYMLDAM